MRQSPGRLAGIVDADETFPLESRNGERGFACKARRRGGKAERRGLSHERVPVLVVTAHVGAMSSITLPVLRAGSLTSIMGPVITSAALPVSDANGCRPSAARAPGTRCSTCPVENDGGVP